MRKQQHVLSLVACLALGCSASQNPPMPNIGPLVDRAGRPFASEALAAPFVTGDDHAMAAARWKSGGAAERVELLLPSLAAYDALDGECGNQMAAGPPGATRYQPLADILADDRLLIDTRAGTCQRLLAVETGTSTDCGGFAPTVDVPEALLSALVSGAASGVTDGVDRDPDGSPSLVDFPFLLDPTL